MAEYIEREAAKDELCERCTNVLSCTRSDNDCPIKRGLNAIPAADVRPVVHGKWIMNSLESCYYYKCSVCGGEVATRWNFCHHCGADMREVERD